MVRERQGLARLATASRFQIRQTLLHRSYPSKKNHHHLLTSTRTKYIDSIDSIVERLGIRLTESELNRLRRTVDANGDGVVTPRELSLATQQPLLDKAARDLCLSVVERPDNKWDRFIGRYAVGFCDVSGTVLYALAGTQVAGDTGMNVVGCTLVGCATALGGGTLNNLLYGTKVFWVQQPSYLLMAVGASLATFVLWPYYCSQQADSYLQKLVTKSHSEEDQVSRTAFLRACRRDNEFWSNMKEATGKESPEEIFDLLDHNHTRTLDRDKLRRLTQSQFDHRSATYILDTLALSNFAVSAAYGGIAAGVNPLVAASAGVTICAGGVFRDVLCHRPVAIGAQSYAFCTGSGATVYVILRELCVRGWKTSLFTRIVLTAGTTIGLRYWEYMRGVPLLAPMHGRPSTAMMSA